MHTQKDNFNTNCCNIWCHWLTDITTNLVSPSSLCSTLSLPICMVNCDTSSWSTPYRIAVAKCHVVLLPPSSLYYHGWQWHMAFLFLNDITLSLTFLTHVHTLFQGFFKENVRHPVWTCRDPTLLILGTWIGSLKKSYISLFIYWKSQSSWVCKMKCLAAE